MRFFKKSIGFILTFLLFSCASTVELPPMPNYGSRDDYPDLIEKTGEAQGDFQGMKFNKDSLIKAQKMAKVYAEKLNCTTNGSVHVSVVVTKAGKVDAPLIQKSLGENCNKAAMLALTHLKFDDPARVDGKPVAAVIMAPFRFGVN